MSARRVDEGTAEAVTYTAQDVERELKQHGLWAAFESCETPDEHCEFVNFTVYSCITKDETWEFHHAFV